MENKKLAEKLREFARGTSSAYKKQIYKQAARRLEEQAATLEKAAQLLLLLEKILPGMDGGCDLCDHKDVEKVCLMSDEMILCDNCPGGCYCQDCGPHGSKWENSMLKEAIKEVTGNDG